MSKIKKVFSSPHLYLRDFLLKKYPLVLNEINCKVNDEFALIKYEEFFEEIDNSVCIDANADIDVVFTWVNGEDEKWIEKLKRFKNENYLGEDFHNLKFRFGSNNEIEYSVKRLLSLCPWVRNIYIVTDGQIPDFLKKEKIKNVEIIDHKQVIPEKYLPTFNSHVIEAHIHRIQGLAEKFIYFNDDVFVGRPLSKSHFFKSNGIASLFVSSKIISKLVSNGKMTPTLRAIQNSNELLYKIYKSKGVCSLVHTYFPLRKSIFSKIYKEYYESHETNNFFINKFRSENDINFASYLVPWAMYFEKVACVSKDICHYFNIRSPHGYRVMNNLIVLNKYGMMPHSFCANDFATKEYEKVNAKSLLKNFFKEMNEK